MKHTYDRYKVEVLADAPGKWRTLLTQGESQMFYACDGCTAEMVESGISEEEGVRLRARSDTFYMLCELCGRPATHEVGEEQMEGVNE